MYGKTEWLIADCYWPEVTTEGHYVSHEAICVLNAGDRDAEIEITLFFEDAEPLAGFRAFCAARRTNHIRMDKIVSKDGRGVERGIPYAMTVESDVPIVVQYSRCDTTQAELSFMGLLAY